MPVEAKPWARLLEAHKFPCDGKRVNAVARLLYANGIPEDPQQILSAGHPWTWEGAVGKLRTWEVKWLCEIGKRARVLGWGH